MTLELITAAAMPAVSMAEAKDHLRIDGAEYDSDLALKLAAAQIKVEQSTGPLVDSAWDLHLDAFPDGDEIVLPLYEASAVASVKYTPAGGAQQTVDAGDYELVRTHPPRVVLKDGKSWPAADLKPRHGVTVRFDAGWADAASVPQDIKSAILLELGHLWENREETVLSMLISRPIASGSAVLLTRYARALALAYLE